MSGVLLLSRQIVPCFCLGWLLVPSDIHAASTFQLEAGSVFTPLTGSPEPLSGMFTLGDAVSVPDPHDPEGEPILFFNATAFDLRSPSVSLSLGTLPLQLLRSINGLSAPTYQWGGYLDSAGLPVASVLLSQRTHGFYDETRFVFPEIQILDTASGMQHLGSLSFSAAAVPEPGTLALFMTGLGAAFACGRWKVARGSMTSVKAHENLPP